jgi:hypothetical protein
LSASANRQRLFAPVRARTEAAIMAAKADIVLIGLLVALNKWGGFQDEHNIDVNSAHA